ncbi:uncharacterized protein LOC116738708 [Nasonia vitripennis]|uniref:Uncharacterized protein n=1 Tax=Nasonia vitripennis TaxID=7425 RepID=A0A7M7R2M5_NASVI|nr:uncharacterized protein LOC116738708 [Nasonia vitripennis]
MVQLKTLVQDKRPFGDSEHVLSLEKLKEIYDVTLPMETSTEFYNFNSKIVHDNYISLKTYFGCNINTQEKNIAAKVITPIFKTFFSKDLVRKFTAQKKSKDEYIFKDSKFYDCLFDAMQNAHSKKGQTVTNADLLGLIGTVINNAADWDRGRDSRKRTRDQDSDGNDI